MTLGWDALAPDEAGALFDAHVADHPAALRRFEDRYNSNRGKRKDLTYEPSSLVPIFRWAMKRFSLPNAPLPAAEAEGPSAAAVHWARIDPMEYCRLGHDLAAVADGIGSYVSETVLRADRRARWWRETDARNGGFNQPAVRIGGGLWLHSTAVGLCSKGWRKLDLGYGNRADDPERLAEHVGAILALAGTGPDPSDDELVVEPVGAALHVTFSDGAAHERSEVVDRYVVEAAGLVAVDGVSREDRDLVVVDLAPAADADAVTAELVALWDRLT